MNIITKLLDFTDTKVKKYGAAYFSYGLFVLLTYPLSCIYTYYFGVTHESIPLRLTSTALCFLLVINKHMPYRFQKYLSLYWYSVIIFTLPFFGTYMLFKNSESTSWLMNNVLGMFLLILLVDWFMFVVTLSIGILGGYITYRIVEGPVEWAADFNSTMLAIYMYVFAFLLGTIFSRNKEIFNANALQIKDALNHELEEKVDKRTRSLKEALDAKSYFLRNVNHEIRTPVQIITTMSGELKDNWTKLPKAKIVHLLSELDRYAARLFSLVTNVLDLSKFDAGKMLFDTKENDLSHAITNVIDEFKPLARDRKVSINFNSTTENTKAYFDNERIMQVIRNLISNALKYSPQNSQITIALTERSMPIKDGNKAKALCVSVKDRGIGVPEEELVTIFEPFVQSTKTDTKAGGTGLGLSICSEIIYNHSGRIWAENNDPEPGTTFLFMLPLVTESEESKGAKANKLIKVLFVDDEYGCQEIAPMILGAVGCELKVCSSGKEALEYLENNHKEVDVILLDMMMPGVNGLEVLKVLKAHKNYKRIPVLLQTGLDNDLELNKAMSLGAVGHISKPYNKEKMQRQVTELFAEE